MNTTLHGGLSRFVATFGLAALCSHAAAQDVADCANTARACRQTCSVTGAIGKVFGQGQGASGECRAQCEAQRAQCQAAAQPTHDSNMVPAATTTGRPAAEGSVKGEPRQPSSSTVASASCVRFIERQLNQARFTHQCGYRVFMLGREANSCFADELTNRSSPFDLPLGEQVDRKGRVMGNAGQPVAACRQTKVPLIARCMCPEGADLPAELAVLRAAYEAPLPAMPQSAKSSSGSAAAAPPVAQDQTTVQASPARSDVSVGRAPAVRADGFVILTWKHLGKNPFVDPVSVMYDTTDIMPITATPLRRPNWTGPHGHGMRWIVDVLHGSYHGGTTFAALTKEGSLEAFLREFERRDKKYSRSQLRIDRLSDAPPVVVPVVAESPPPKSLIEPDRCLIVSGGPYDAWNNCDADTGLLFVSAPDQDGTCRHRWLSKRYDSDRIPAKRAAEVKLCRVEVRDGRRPAVQGCDCPPGSKRFDTSALAR